MTRFRTWVGLAMAFFLSAVPAVAEILPTRGTFRGIYYENRAGVGRFHYFIVPKDLRMELARYDGKYVEVEVLAGRQPINPGPAIISRIGKVRELGPEPVDVKITTFAPGSGGPDTFDILYSFRNTTKQTVTLDASLVAIGLASYRDVGGNPDEVDGFFKTGYTRKQLAYGGDPTQRWNFIWPMAPGASTHFAVGSVRLGPGEEVPFIWHGLPNKPGSHEVVVSATCSTPTENQRPIRAWKPLDLPAPKQKPVSGGTKARATVARDGDWVTVDGKLVNDDPSKLRHIFVQPTGGHVLLPGLVQLQDKRGKPLGADLAWAHPSGPWVRREIDKNGLSFRFRVRQSDRFTQAPEGRLEFWTLTTGGLQKLTISEELPAGPVRPEPKWGETTNGARLRIRPAKTTYAAGERVSLYYQGECDRKNADILWINDGNFHTHVLVTIDGKPVRIGSSGLPDGHVIPFPFQGNIELAADDLKPGKHRLRLTVRGDAGIYTNLNRQRFRQFEGTLVSNEVEMRVKGR